MSNGKEFAEFQKLSGDEKLDFLYIELKDISDWKRRLVSLPAKIVYFLLAALSVATFVLGVLR